MCREEDDSNHILELGGLRNYDSEEEEYNEKEEKEEANILQSSSQIDSSSEGQKNNNEKLIITPVPDTQCHCCAEDIKTAHSGGEFKCTSCDLSFKKNSSLERHTIVIHWKCDTCICKECGSTFKDKKALNRHRYTTHSNKKIHRCEVCDIYFSRRYHLNRHKMQSGCHGNILNTYDCQVSVLYITLYIR